MSSDRIAAHITRESWSFTLNHFSYFFKITIFPLLLSIALNGFSAFSLLLEQPLPQALIDGMGGFIEALWGIRWFRFILEKDRRTDVPKFAFGKAEFLYFIYSFILLVPFMMDDFIFSNGFRSDYAFLYVAMALGLLVVFLRFEFIFPALSLGEKTGFIQSLEQSKSVWGNLLKSYCQSLLVILPLGSIVFLILGFLLISLWILGCLHLEGWHMQDGWNVLLDRNPIIVWFYIIIKEGFWCLVQGFTMVIAATYYALSKKKLT